MAAAVLLLAACDEATVIVETTLLDRTTDILGPYRVTTVVRDPDGVDHVYLFHCKYGRALAEACPRDAFRAIPLADEGGAYTGEIPGTGAPDFTVQYYVEARDGDEVVTDPPEAATTFAFDVVGPHGACEGDADCLPEEVCDEEFCSPSAGICDDDDGCPEGHVCDVGGRCRPAVRACGADEDCLIAEICDGPSCVPRPICTAAEDCPDGFGCSTDAGVCVRLCESDEECPAGRACAFGRCEASDACEVDGDCASGESCDLDGICREQGGAAGADCSSDADCGGATDYCLLHFEDERLFCGADCSEAPCDAGFSCCRVAVPEQCLPDAYAENLDCQ